MLVHTFYRLVAILTTKKCVAVGQNSRESNAKKRDYYILFIRLTSIEIRYIRVES
jgi:hypothetical protein